jgi:dihydrofolate reductase
VIAKISVFVATSLDGFIARKDGSIDWIRNSIERFPSNQDNGYQNSIESINVIIRSLV